MALTYVSGDPLLTQAHVLAFAHNSKGHMALGAFENALYYRHPAAFATFRRRARRGAMPPGALWLWRESRPHLGFMVLRSSAVGTLRSRFVEAALLTLARDYRLYGIESLALAPLGTGGEWAALRPMIVHWLSKVPLPIEVYERYVPGAAGEPI